MSEYIVCDTKYTCKEALIDALVEIGVPLNNIEVHQEATNLYGFTGDKRKQKANIIIRRKNVSCASNDIGFEQQADGTWKTIVSEYDKRATLGRRILAKNKGGTGELDMQYAKKAVLRTIGRTYGHVLKSCEQKNGKIHIRVAVTT